MERNYGVLVQMDADLSHDPADLPRLLASLDTYDVVIGSRYVAGGGVKRWGVLRRLLSRFASAYARLLLGVRICDLTTGFTGWRREALETIPLAAIRSEGYSFLIELKFRAHLAGLRLHEIPIVFVDRRAGHSKLSWRVIFEAVYRVWFLSLARRSLAAEVNPRARAPEERR
jgi:dolichol-phosphate mannosyltransferase